MAAPRLLALLKLLLILGLPIAVVAGLFGYGVVLGVEHRVAIARFERDVLHMDVEVPDPPPERAPETPPTAAAEPVPPSTSPVEPAPLAAADPAPSAPIPSAPAPAAAAPTPTPAPTPTEPITSELAAKLSLPVAVGVKVLVDPELIRLRADWIDYVQRTISMASEVYRSHFGVTLELVSVSRWNVATAGLDADGLLLDVRARPREGADVLVGFTARPFDGSVAGKSEVPVPESPFNGAHAVVYASSGVAEPHLRTLLHEVGHLFGALDVTDPEDPDFRAGSWMSYASVPESQVPWIDAENRKRILGRKDRPFVPEGRGTR